MSTCARVYRPAVALALLLLLATLFACGGGSSGPGTTPSNPVVTSVALSSPVSVTSANSTVQFTATVIGTGNYSREVSWSVNDIKGGNSTIGTISNAGLYTAPARVPDPPMVTIKAASVADATKYATSALTIVPPPTVDYVYLYPTFVQIHPGEHQQFEVSVIGTGNFAAAYKLYVNEIEGGSDVVGRITSSGLYTAPSTPPVPNTVTVKAVSVYDTTKSASAQVQINASPGTVAVVVSPPSAEMQLGAKQQFTATVTGTADKRVKWSAGAGTIDATGIYTAPASGCCTDTVTASSEVDPTAQGTAIITLIQPDPQLTSVSPEAAQSGDFIKISGDHLYCDNQIGVYFTGPNGVLLYQKTPCWNNLNNEVYARVPMGATTGPLWIELLWQSGRTVRSNALTFTRIPRIRAVPATRELAAGESTQIQVRLTGANSSSELTWTATLGSVTSDGTYTAPASVGQETLVTITACLADTTECEPVHVRVHPFRIEPFRGVIALGDTLHLDAVAGSSRVTPVWELWSPAGSMLATGDYTAGGTLRDAGNVAVHATYSGAQQTSSVGVTGGFPGEVGRIYDYIDDSWNPPDYHSNYSDIAVADKGRLYAVFANEVQPYTSQTGFYLDVYDVSDITRPVFLDSIEPPLRPDDMWISGNSLFMRTASDYTSDNSPAFAAYDLSSGTPSLRTYDRTITPGGSRNGDSILYCDLYDGSGSPAKCSEYNITTAARTNYSLPMPAGIPSSYTVAAARSGKNLYLAFDDAGPDYHLLTYDVSTTPAVLRDSQLLSTALYYNYLLFDIPSPIPHISGSIMIVGNYVCDISGEMPVLRSKIPLSSITDFDGKLVSGTGPVWQETRVFDVSNPDQPVWISAFEKDAWEIDSALPYKGRLYGDHLLVPGGRSGLVIYDVSTPGGLRERQMTGHLGSAVFDQKLIGNILYSAEAWGVGGALQPWDVSAHPATELPTIRYETETPYALAANGNTLYVGTDGALRIYNIASPTSPTQVGSLPLPTSALAISGNWLFVSALSASNVPELAVLDISNASSPLVVSEIALPGFPIKLTVAAGTLYAAADKNGLLVIDVSQPANPQLLTQWQPAPYVEDVVIEGNRALIAADQHGLLIADVTNPSQPVEISENTLPGIPYVSLDTLYRPSAISLGLRNGYVYIGSYMDNGHVYVYDYRNGSHPRLISRSRTYGEYSDSFVVSFNFSETRAYFAGWNDDYDGITPPGAEVDDYQPGNVIFLHPKLAESIEYRAPSSSERSGAEAMKGTRYGTTTHHPKLRRFTGEILGIKYGLNKQ